MSTIGKLEPVPVRELWTHEERGFSAWLEANLDVLSEAIGVTLADPQRELLAGNFQVDLLAEDENGDPVIVENQLEATNHDHLGKPITYITNLDAKAVNLQQEVAPHQTQRPPRDSPTENTPG